MSTPTSVTLTVTAHDMDMLKHQLRQILEAQAVNPALAIEAPPAESEKPVEPAKQTRTRKPKAEAPAETKPEPEAKVEPSEAQGHPDIEALRGALKRLASADGHGADAVFALLGQYGVKNASTLPEDKRADVIAKINEKLGG